MGVIVTFEDSVTHAFCRLEFDHNSAGDPLAMAIAGILLFAAQNTDHIGEAATIAGVLDALAECGVPENDEYLKQLHATACEVKAFYQAQRTVEKESETTK